MKKLGLIGYPLGHSFSKKYYLQKFEQEGIADINYDLYAIEDIQDFQHLYSSDIGFYGFNVTIPHKRSVMQFIHELSAEAQEINAVNCIKIKREGDGIYLKGFNTDAFGFEESLRPLLKPVHRQALVLGNGGAAKAVIYTLKKLNIPHLIVSRTQENGDLTYEALKQIDLKNYQIIINCSPVGTFPHVQYAPDINYEQLSTDHLLYDLIYNPTETLFLQKGKQKGAVIKNGHEMLILQAEKNWEIWNNEE